MVRLQEIEDNNVRMIEEVYNKINRLEQDLFFVPGIEGKLKDRSDEYMKKAYQELIKG